ncbi:MAG: hypothetical protein AAB966_05665 [Patescibacteria group bacterium]
MRIRIHVAFTGPFEIVSIPKFKGCRKYPKDQELTILTNPDTGIITIGYMDENGQPKESQLSYKSKDGFVGCSAQAARILSDVKTYQDKYNSDKCTEITEIVEGERPMLEMDGKRPTMNNARIYQKQVCDAASDK